METTPPTTTPSATPTAAVSTYLSEPEIQAPRITVTTNKAGAAPALVLYAAKGGGLPSELILSRSDGTLVWQRSLPKGTSADALQMQQWHGSPVLSWWQGTQNSHGYGSGDNLVIDETYRTVDLRPYGGQLGGIILDCLVQEVDVATGLVLFEWHALDHVSPSDSRSVPQATPQPPGISSTSTASTRVPTVTC